MNNLKRIIRAYRDLLGILFPRAPVMVVSVFVVAFTLGGLQFLSVSVNRRVFDMGLALARGELTFDAYVPYVAMFVALAIIPGLLNDVYIYGFVEPRTLLILRTTFKGRMLEKLSRMKYEHLENRDTVEIIDKAYHRAENSARHLFPMYVASLQGLVFGIAILVYVASIKWWMILPIVIPVLAETMYGAKLSVNVYDELERYWGKERAYKTLGGYLRNRAYFGELKLFNSAKHLINTYRSRLNARNREYEKYYFKHLRNNFVGDNITKIAKFANAVLVLHLFLAKQITIGTFIALSSVMLSGVFEGFLWFATVFRFSYWHINFFDFYNTYLDLSEDDESCTSAKPVSTQIEFKDVWFRYPGTDRDILKGISFTVQDGEKLSLVGENGEGKSTIVKLLLGLFSPDKGEILLGGAPLSSYSHKARTGIFGPVFQDFVRYSISLKENIGMGSIDNVGDEKAIEAAARKGKVDAFLGQLSEGYDTLLGRDFQGGIDLSGGQWQRVALARAFMGNKPVLLLDEPTSQLDPIAESELYREFAEMAHGKTSIFITHRLASTMITDRILVIQNGVVAQEGTHSELMTEGGLYADMFDAQKKWYIKTPVTGGVRVG